MNAYITREPFVFAVFRRVLHSTLKLELCRYACRRRDPIISTCRYGKNMPTTALLHTSSNRLLLSNQDKGCTPSVAHSLPLPLGPALLNLWTVFT